MPMTPDTLPVRDFIHAKLDPAGASAILDLGCGSGTDLQQIGRLAGTDTRLVGLDASEPGIAAARQATAADPRYAFALHDVARRLPSGDGEFDRVMSVNLLECIPHKQQLLREVHRVLAPGGRVVFAHWDWDSQTIDGADKDLVRRIVHAFGDWKQGWMADADAWMGRRLWRTFQESGLFSGSVHPIVLTSTRFQPGTYGHDAIESFRGLVKRGVVSANEYDAFHRDVAELARGDRYFYSITMFVYVGHRR